MSNYQEYLKQIEELSKKAEAARKEETSSVIADIKAKIKAFGLTAEDLGLEVKKTRGRPAKAGPGRPAAAKKESAPARRGRPSAQKGIKRKIKYRGPEGQAWSGVGRKPVWVVEALAAGRTLEEFLAE
jgi:DNA-binding protein H-NS